MISNTVTKTWEESPKTKSIPDIHSQHSEHSQRNSYFQNFTKRKKNNGYIYLSHKNSPSTHTHLKFAKD